MKNLHALSIPAWCDTRLRHGVCDKYLQFLTVRSLSGHNDPPSDVEDQRPAGGGDAAPQPIRSERFTHSGASNNANLQCIHAGGGKWYYLQWCNHKSWDKLTNLWVQIVSGGNYTTGSSIAIIAAYNKWNGKDYIFRNDTFVKPLFYLARG